MRINAKTIKHSLQKYCTTGDYWIDKKGTIQVRISECSDKYEWLVLIHEIVEIFLCLQQNVKFKDIDNFDIQFEKDRGVGAHSDTEEPGDSPEAPYARQHCMATAVERMLCGYLRIPWKVYENCLNGLEYYKPKNRFAKR